ncbi:Ser/Thr protein kinase RdoA involved in Cpx stress response, MazF antagonist [Seinonella peptonophila]|uniref:Ser/Thr protein kinase RdoA involved in Cpx stress response, MazF antagonist n=1 Tax=Seinonella peptonophila TaxID=112248 RepID=A0A1M4WKC7_9BACL|nr:hypothetical protein [Seinonella peptonophila]SHE81666.1 Ser/Thr protein kinase RdoA involved in Cpx stress response, MazF antagonist [Seinonella peptonophila]
MTVEELIQWTGDMQITGYLDEHYQLEVKQAKKYRGVIQLATNRGLYALKEVADGEQNRIRLWAEVGKQLQPNLSMLTPIETKSGQVTFRSAERTYTLLPWAKAMPIRLRTVSEWEWVTQRIAEFHLSSQQIELSRSYHRYRQVGKWGAKWRNAFRQLELYLQATDWSITTSDRYQAWNHFVVTSTNRMGGLIRYYNQMDGDQLCIKMYQYGKVCHGNLHRHHLLIDTRGNLHFVDGTQMVLDCRTYDLAKWLLYAYGRTGNIRFTLRLLHAYQQIAKLESSEYAMIYAQMIFPGHLFDVLQHVYRDQTLPIAAGGTALQKAMIQEERKEKLLTQFPKLVNQVFRVEVPPFQQLNHKK